MFNIPKAEQRYSETELDLQRKLEYDRGYSDGRASIVEELEKIKDRIAHIRNCGMGKNKSLEYIEKYINGEMSELKGGNK